MKRVLRVDVVLPHPPGVNHGPKGWNAIGRGGTVYTTKAAKAWIEASKLHLMAAGARRLPSDHRYEVTVDVDLFTADNIDLDKRIPIVLDTVQAVTGVNDKFLYEMHARKYVVHHVADRSIRVLLEIFTL